MRERIVSNWLVDKLLRKPMDACSVYPFIFIRPAWAFNTPLLEHERVHQRSQRKMGTLKWWWRYWRDVDFRVAEEVLAYQRQVELGLPKTKAAELLADYSPDLTPLKAFNLL